VNIHKTPTSYPSKAIIYTSECFQGLPAETAAKAVPDSPVDVPIGFVPLT